MSPLSTSALQKDIRETLCSNGLHCWQQCYRLELQVGGVSLCLERRREEVGGWNNLWFG